MSYQNGNGRTEKGSIFSLNGLDDNVWKNYLFVFIYSDGETPYMRLNWLEK